MRRCSQSPMPRASSRFTYSMNSFTSAASSILPRMLRMISTPARLTPRSRVSERIVSRLLEVFFRVEARVAFGARRLQQALALVEAQRLRMDVVFCATALIM